jgi:hypothetical protein
MMRVDEGHAWSLEVKTCYALACTHVPSGCATLTDRDVIRAACVGVVPRCTMLPNARTCGVDSKKCLRGARALRFALFAFRFPAITWGSRSPKCGIDSDYTLMKMIMNCVFSRFAPMLLRFACRASSGCFPVFSVELREAPLLPLPCVRRRRGCRGCAGGVWLG